MPPPKIKIEKTLYENARRHAAAAGYASVDEFVAHLIEKQVNQPDDVDPDEEVVRKRLRGLGYIS